MAKIRSSKTRNQNHDGDASSSRRKRFKSFEKGGVGPWSDLNRDVLFLVMMQLGGVVDFIAFSRVCKSWRSLALTNRKIFMASMPPMSMWISIAANEKDSYVQLDDFQGRMSTTILPHSAGRTCFGVTCGYVILWDWKTRDFWLVNPITRHQLHFPNFPLHVDVYEETTKAILAFSPSISGWVFVVLHLHSEISFYILGKRSWSFVSSTLHSTPDICDLHAFKGKIYTLHTDCSLRELRLDPNRNHKWTLLETKNCPKQGFRDPEPELVNSRENFYMIHREKILELDFGEMKWVLPKMKEHACFVSKVKVKPIVVIKPVAWAHFRVQNTAHDYFFHEHKTGQCMFYHKWMWYFPDDSLNADVNLLDE